MSATHDYDTEWIPARDLNNTHVLVGESGGLSAVYDTAFVSGGKVYTETEHGTLVHDAFYEVEVLK